MFSASVANRLGESRDPTATSELQPEKAWGTRCLNIIRGWGTGTEVEVKKLTENNNFLAVQSYLCEYYKFTTLLCPLETKGTSELGN